LCGSHKEAEKYERENKMQFYNHYFFPTLKGPGSVWVQSLPFSRLASRVFAVAPSRGGSSDEGSLAKGLFNLFDGD
jgi:hypothetical protein